MNQILCVVGASRPPADFQEDYFDTIYNLKMRAYILTVAAIAVALFISNTAMAMLGYENYRILRGWHIDAGWQMMQTIAFLLVFYISFSGIFLLLKKR